MAAPPKPWETAGVLNRQNVGIGSSFIDQMSSSLPGAPMSRPSLGADLRPGPVRPMRPQTSNYSSGFGRLGYGGGFGGFGGGGLNSFGMYSGLGGYSPYGGSIYGNYGMNRLGSYDDFTSNSFAQQAEMSSRHAFQSIESVVRVFGSIAMMLESTFQAVYSSFRAVIGVADHFSRMRTHMAKIFSALAIMRTLRWLVRKLLVLIRLRSPGVDDELWSQAMESATSVVGPDGVLNDKPRTNWPIMLFFALVIGGPWLIWKLLTSLAGTKGVNAWASGVDDHYVAVAEYDFEGENNDELSFKKGTQIILAPKDLQPRIQGWLLASVDGQTTGIVPANHIKLLGPRPGRKREETAVTRNNTLAPQSSFNRMDSFTNAAVPSLEIEETNLSRFEKEFQSEEPQIR